MNRPLLLVHIALIGLLASCGGSSSSPDAVAGPCYQLATEPVLTLVSASDGTSNAAIGELALSDIKVDGVPLPPGLIAHLSSSAKVVGSELQCTLPCGFGETVGTYTATATAAGYRPLSLSIAASYSSSVGNCPNTVSGGTRAVVVFQTL